MNYLPRAVQPRAKAALQEIWMADTQAAAIVALDQFVRAYGAKYPKAVDCLIKDREALFAFFEFPAEHGWRRLRGFRWLAKVIRGVKFRDGIEVRAERRAALPQEGSRIAA